MPFLNLGVVAHVDAGKTSLTERLLHAGGVIDHVGRVDAGDTQTDSLELERRRGITIKTAVASFPVGDVTVNLIDTPGHPDFIAEVERALRILDGAVLVVSAVEGVQAQTRVLMRTLRRLRVPTLIFVNKIDRSGAREASLLRELADRLTPAIVPVGTVIGAGTPGASVRPLADTARLVDLSGDAGLLAEWVRDEEAIPASRLTDVLTTRTRAGLLHPVFFGSAVTGAGIPELMAALPSLLPTTPGTPDGPLSGTIFKVDRDPTGRRLAYVRLFSGTLHLRDHIPVGAPAPAGTSPSDTFEPRSPDPTVRAGGSAPTTQPDRTTPAAGKHAVITGIEAIEGGSGVRRKALVAGQIGKLHGLREARIGDAVGVGPAGGQLFAPPTLESVVTPLDPADGRRLHAALTELAGQDPLINLRQDGRELSVSLYGEVQKEVIGATLTEAYGIAVAFDVTRTIHIERPAGVGRAGRTLGKDGNPTLATLDLRVEPGTGVTFDLDVPVEQVPIHVFKAVELFRESLASYVADALARGPSGWRVTDVHVTATRTGFVSPATRAADFRKLVPIVLGEALAQAGTVVCEPISRFRLDVPPATLSAVLAALGRYGAIPERSTASLIEGFVPAARVRALEQAIPGLTHGEGVVETTFDRYERVGCVTIATGDRDR
ncbi:GTP-binding protein [Actinoplanes sp. NPDC049596]|uniref:GTP-binding protein n=1 Tax=unclassified Actinoplanes TaxID=2626549 RepID=UPI00344A384B